LVLQAISEVSAFNGVTASLNYVTTLGGVIAASGGSKVVVTNSTFTSNKSVMTASVFYFLGTEKNSITSSTFTLNEATEGNTLMFLFAETSLTNVTVKNNIADEGSTGIFVTFSELKISSSTFDTDVLPTGYTSIQIASTLTSNLGCFISISAGSTITLTGSTFNNGYAQSGGHIYMAGNSDLTIVSCTFSEGYASADGGAIFASGFSTVAISDSTFTSHTALRDGSDLYLSSGVTTLTGTNFTIKPNPSSIYVSSGKFTATNINVGNSDTTNTEITEELSGGSIHASNTESFSVSSSTFSNINFAKLGGAIYITYLASLKDGSIPATASFSIASTTFTSNAATKGGAIYVDNVDYAEIRSCTFTSNEANTETDFTDGNGEGGAIYYASSGKPIYLIDYRFCFSAGTRNRKHFHK
jgi:predicted outer membrane repeat protein